MLIRDIARLVETWAPPAVAWEKDNVGLNIGDPRRRVNRILVTLDTTPAVVSEAVRLRADLIVSHHPLIFRPLRSIDGRTRDGKMLLTLAEKKIGLYAAHTNFDFTTGGVSFTLAGRLGLKDVTLLSPSAGTDRKITVFVPQRDADRVMRAMSAAGAGVIGRYSMCSFRTVGTGTFLAGDGARPAVGRKGGLERVDEARLEMELPEWKTREVLDAMKSAHPYEEVAYDLHDILNDSRQYGMGAIGDLPRSSGLSAFLGTVRRRLRARGIRYSGPSGTRIRRVAVCGGSGSELLRVAIGRGADAFVTADVRYHTFQEHESKIVLIDAGHFETERPAVKILADFLRSRPAVKDARIKILESKTNGNPVQYHRP